MSEVKQRVWWLGRRNIQKVVYRVRAASVSTTWGSVCPRRPHHQGTTALAAPTSEPCSDGVRGLVGHEAPRRPPGSVRGREGGVEPVAHIRSPHTAFVRRCGPTGSTGPSPDAGSGSEWADTGRSPRALTVMGRGRPAEALATRHKPRQDNLHDDPEIPVALGHFV